MRHERVAKGKAAVISNRTRHIDGQSRARESTASTGRLLVAGAALWILALHPVLQALRLPVPVLGPLDWTAHLATALLLIANLPRPTDRLAVIAALVASMALDIDHVPQYLGFDVLTEGTPRPYLHSLATVLALAALGAALPRSGQRAFALGVAGGVLAHLLRDVATGDGVALLWPLSSTAVRVPFWSYAAVIAALATRAWFLSGAGRPGRSSGRRHRS